MLRLWLILFGIGLTTLITGARVAWAENHPMQAEKIAPESWALIADMGYFTPENGGFLVNTAFISTSEGVIVIGSGPSLAFGKQYRRYIEDLTQRPIQRVLITHKHPDHFLGNQAFKDRPIEADALTTQMLQKEGDGLAENLYRLVGDRMKGTEFVAPNTPLTLGKHTIGGHTLEYISASGHTQSDVAVYDHTTGVLYAIDQVFNGRTPTMPNAHIKNWLASLDRLEAIPFKVLVAGHGPVSHNKQAIQATRDYLQWLDKTLKNAANQGLSATEVMKLPIPAPFSEWTEARDEWRRTVGFMYSQYETAALPKID